MPLYEHVFIARQDLSNTQAEGLIEHFSTVLADNGGKVVENEYWGVKTMAYKINKNRKGHYAFLKSDAPAAAVQEMERLMRLHDDVMRVLTVVSTIFMPLTFIVGIYGMNFDIMPELRTQNGYFVVLGIMALIAGVMIFFFRRRRWM